jgi:phosphoribosylaminoimidazolecarboxamide formyltransferase/IMP cyclohydrolase
MYASGSPGITAARQLGGKEMSYNNYLDADAAWRLVSDFQELAVAIIKHTNPSGVGLGESVEQAYRRALATDPVSAFGGIVAVNRRLDAQTAASISEIFTEVVIAPGYEPEALETLKKKKNLRVLELDVLNPANELELRQISGGMLVQEADGVEPENELNIVTKKTPTDAELDAMELAWKVCKHVKSNAIVICDSRRTLGIGAGQMNRVDSVRIAAMRAARFELPLKGAALASDAFFPFRDNVDEAAKLGVAAIIQPGVSIRDEEVISAADEHGIAMAFTGVRHFKH